MKSEKESFEYMYEFFLGEPHLAIPVTSSVCNVALTESANIYRQRKVEMSQGKIAKSFSQPVVSEKWTPSVYFGSTLCCLFLFWETMRKESATTRFASGNAEELLFNLIPQHFPLKASEESRLITYQTVSAAAPGKAPALRGALGVCPPAAQAHSDLSS